MSKDIKDGIILTIITTTEIRRIHMKKYMIISEYENILSVLCKT